MKSQAQDDSAGILFWVFWPHFGTVMEVGKCHPFFIYDHWKCLNITDI